MALENLTLLQARDSLRRGETTSTALTETLLDRIARLDGDIHSYLTVTAEAAREQARAADAQLNAWRAAGATGDLPALLGVPLALKDVLCTMGVQTTAGSQILKSFLPPYNATAVARLRAAGAVFLGKLNTDEFAMGSSTENSSYGVTRNPWDTSRVPGGSSGGSAAATAARLAYGTLGSDTGGSVRQPGALCGVVGLKPSYGRVSRYGLIAYASSLDQIGPITRTVADAALLLQVIAGHDPLDATSLPDEVPDYLAALDGATDLQGVRLGLPKGYLSAGLEPDVQARVQAAIDRMADLGAEIIEIELPHVEYALPTYYLIATAEASSNLARFDGIRYGPRAEANGLLEIYRQTRGQDFGPEVKRRIMLGTYALSAGYYDAYYGRAQKARTLIKQDYDQAFEQVDLIVGPTSPTTAFKIGEKADNPLAMYLSDIFTIPTNLAGLPGISVPCGFDGQGLPIGLQLQAPALAEAQLLRVAHVYEQAAGWWQQVAPI